MASDADRVVQKLLKLSANLGDATRLGVNGAAERLVLPALQAQVAADTGGDSRMSGLGRKKFAGAGGGLVNATFRPARSTKNPTAYVGPWGKGMAGAFGILEGGTREHVTGGKTSSRIARKGRKKDGTVTYNRVANPRSAGRVLMRTPFGPRWGPFIVGGSPAKQTVSKAARRVAAYVPGRIQSETQKAIVKAGFRR